MVQMYVVWDASVSKFGSFGLAMGILARLLAKMRTTAQPNLPDDTAKAYLKGTTRTKQHFPNYFRLERLMNLFVDSINQIKQNRFSK